jgi:hypothetical protein
MAGHTQPPSRRDSDSGSRGSLSPCLRGLGNGLEQKQVRAPACAHTPEGKRAYSHAHTNHVSARAVRRRQAGLHSNPSGAPCVPPFSVSIFNFYLPTATLLDAAQAAARCVGGVAKPWATASVRRRTGSQAMEGEMMKGWGRGGEEGGFDRRLGPGTERAMVGACWMATMGWSGRLRGMREAMADLSRVRVCR